MALARIIQGPHQIFTSANGQPCFGVRVKAIEHDPKSGYLEEWNVNETTFLGNPQDAKEKLGLSDEEYEQVAAEFRRLMSQTG